MFDHTESIAVPGHLHFRFWMQYVDMGEMAWSKDEFGKRIMPFVDSTLSEFTYLFNLRDRIQTEVDTYKNGVSDGRFLKVDERGRTELNKSKEKDIQELAKDFFIHLKLLLVKTFKSGVITDATFDAARFFFVDPVKLTTRADEYVRTSDGRYQPIIAQIIKANTAFLSGLNAIRGEIEHEAFSLPPFQLTKTAEGYLMVEPTLDGTSLMVTVNRYYERVFDFIEKIIAYFIGVNGEIRWNGAFRLHVGREVDYVNGKNRFILVPGDGPMWYPTDRCLYD